MRTAMRCPRRGVSRSRPTLSLTSCTFLGRASPHNYTPRAHSHQSPIHFHRRRKHGHRNANRVARRIELAMSRWARRWQLLSPLREKCPAHLCTRTRRRCMRLRQHCHCPRTSKDQTKRPPSRTFLGRASPHDRTPHTHSHQAPMS